MSEMTFSYKYLLETIAIVPKVILGVHALVVQDSIFTSANDFIPQYDLVHRVSWRLILGREVQEELLNVPVEEWVKVRVQIKCLKLNEGV